MPEVAAGCGCNDDLAFARAFKVKAGTVPAARRARMCKAQKWGLFCEVRGTKFTRKKSFWMGLEPMTETEARTVLSKLSVYDWRRISVLPLPAAGGGR